jgi:hypothetical protein
VYIKKQAMRFKLFWNKLHKVLQVGLCLLFFGSAPLLIVIALDALSIIDAGNGLGFGILTLLTFYPSLVLIVVGGVNIVKEKNKISGKVNFKVFY